MLHRLLRLSLEHSLSALSCSSWVSFSHSLLFTFLCPHLPQWLHLPLNVVVLCGPENVFGSSHYCGSLTVPSHLLPILFLFITACTFLLVFSSVQLMLVSWFSNQSWHGSSLSCIPGGDLPEYGSSGNHH